MTACVKNHSKRVALAISASLVGALTLGAAAPAVAFADEGVSTLALSSTEAFKQGKMTEATDNQGRKLDIPADGIVTVTEGKFVIPTEVTPRDSDPIDIYTAVNADAAHPQNASISYSGDGFSGSKYLNQVKASDFTPGTYTATVTLQDDPGAQLTVTFIVEEAKDLSDAVIFDNSNGANDPTDTTFTYNGKNQIIGVAIDGKILKLNDGNSANGVEDYNITVTQVTDGNGDAISGSVCKDAGTYTVTIDGATGSDYQGQTKKLTLTVGKLDLSKADVSIKDVIKGSTVTITSIVADGAELNTTSNPSLKINATYSANETGAASAVVFAKKDATNITGSATVEFNVVDNVLNDVNFFYGTSTSSQNFSVINTTGQLTFDLNEGQAFKPERVYVTNGTDKLPASYYTVSYADSKGNEVDASALQSPGTYFVKVRVNAEASHYVYGSGTEQIKVVVTRGTMLSSDIVFKFDGKVGDSFNPTYDGTDQLEKLETVVHTQDGGADLVEGTDYTVQAYNEDGDKVDEIVNAGTYTVKIELSSPYAGITDADLTCTIVVGQLDLTAGVSVAGGSLTSYTYDKDTDGDGKGDTPTTVWYLPYTGEELEPTLEFGYYTDGDGKVATYSPASASKLTWHPLPEGAVTVTGYMYDKDDSFTLSDAGDVDAMKGLGTYKVRFAFEDGNYSIPAGVDDDMTANYITVSDAGLGFADVSGDAWYAQSVFQAKQLGYVKGIHGSNLYAPESEITRADALIIISRMAGADQSLGEDWLDQNIGYVTRYSDVDANAYYAKAIAWGTKVGVVSGDANADTFRPNDSITREEFAAMLSNYAKAMGEDISVDADEVLADANGADTVSPWMRDAVAWAYENGVMGNNGASLNAQGDITRAETAAMAVNFQPDGASDNVIG